MILTGIGAVTVAIFIGFLIAAVLLPDEDWLND